MRAGVLLRNPYVFSLLPCLLYWIYLSAASSPYIKYDAEVFVALGESIARNGLAEFFKAEPNYVPLYPILIAISIRISDFLSLPFQCVQIAAQIFIFFITQLLIVRIMRILNIHNNIIMLTILYFGFSPAMINATFSLYSEIITFPFVPWLILATVSGWQTIKSEHRRGLFLTCLGVTVPFFFLTMANAVFEYIFLFFLLSFFFLLFGFRSKDKRFVFMRALTWIALTFLLFEALLLPYRLMNLKYNGYKSLVIKGAWSLYANTQRRTENLSLRQYLVALTYIPGEGVCNKFFTEEECSFWSIGAQHGIGIRKLKELQLKGVPNDKIDSILIGYSRERILQKPIQFTLLTFMESMKMFFWESTRVGYVFYPAWLTEVYNFTLFKNGLRLMLFLLTSIAFIFFIVSTWKNKVNFSAIGLVSEQSLIMFFISIMLVGFIGIHSLFCIATRYTFPVVSLYLIVMAYTFNKIIFKKI